VNLRFSLPGRRARFHPWVWVLFFTLAGFGLRVQRLSFQPLWGDEGWSIYFATQSVPQLLALTAVDIHPPFYYLLLKLWLAVAGMGPEMARFLSVMAGTLLIPALAALAARLADWRAGVLAAAVTAVAPLAVYYSQEVRMYGLVTLLGALSVYFFVRDAGHRHRSAGYLLTTAAALYTMYYSAFVVLAQLLFMLFEYFKPPATRDSLPLSRESDSLWRDNNGNESQESGAGSREPGVSFSLTPNSQPLTPLFSEKGPTRTPNPPRPASLAAALRPFFVVGLLYLPWVLFAGLKLVNYIANKRTVEGYAPLNLIRFFGDHLVAFSVGHLPEHLQLYAWAALPMLLAAGLGAWAVARGRYRRAGLLFFYLLVPLAAGYLVNLVYPFTPRFFERTLLLAAPAYWLLIALGVVWLWDKQFLLVGTLAAAMLLLVAVSLFNFYTLPRTPDEDYRPLLRDIAAVASPDDTLLASYQWQLGFYRAYLPEPRPRLFPVPGWGAGWSAQAGHAAQLTADVQSILAQSPRLWFPAYQAGGHIWEDEAETALAQLGYPTLLKWYSPQTKLTLAAAGNPQPLDIPPANFENKLALESAAVGSAPLQAGRDVVPVELRWRKTGTLGSEHRVSLRLVDSAGRTWATRDSHPRAGQLHFTDLPVGQSLTDRHGLLTPAGAPPGTYRLLLSVRRQSDARPLDLLDETGQPLGAELPLADITLLAPQPPLGPDALPVQTRLNADFGRRARLIGFSLGGGPFKAGEVLPLTLFWQSPAQQSGPLEIVAELQDSAGQTAATYRRPPARPATEWQRGDLLRDPHDIPLPPALPPGAYTLNLSLLDENGSRLPVNGAERLALQTVQTTDRPHLFEPPPWQVDVDANFSDQIRLAGLDLPAEPLSPGDTLPLTLIWQATAPVERNWTVFVHLTDAAGQIIAQQDQIPGAGQFPTTGWLPGEYLTDPYALVLPPQTPPGAYRLEIGLYDANDFSRLPLVAGGQITGDHITLESWPILVE